MVLCMYTGSYKFRVTKMVDTALWFILAVHTALVTQCSEDPVHFGPLNDRGHLAGRL